MKLIFLVFAIILSISSFAQISKEERIQDSIIGWDPNNIYDHYLKPQTTAEGKQKVIYLNKIAEWVKKSYTPVAGLGEYERYANATNYFDVFHVWDVDFNHLDAKKRFRPIGETGFPRFWIGANFIPGAWSLDFMNKGDWFFTVAPNGAVANTKIDSDEKMKGRDPKISPNAYPYLPWINETETIYLAPGNKLPMRLATKGEFLNRALERMDYVEDSLVKEETQKEWRKDATTQANIKKAKKDEVDRIRSGIKKYLDKYKNRLNEPAYVDGLQFRWYDFDPNDDDLFAERKNAFQYPVYIIDAATIKKMSDSKPLWISITFAYSKPTDGNKYQEAYKSLTQNLNLDYIYNYFFDPEKVKGVEYTPANEAGLKARLDGYRRKNKYDLAPADNSSKFAAGVLFQEDFSGDGEGSEPANWYYYNAGATPFTIVKPKNENGNWLKPGFGRAIRPKVMKQLPANFKMEWDVLADANYTDNIGPSIRLELSNGSISANNSFGKSPDPKSASIGISIIAGNEADFNNNNYRGEVRIDVKNYPEVNEENFNKGLVAQYPIREFTNKKTKVHIAVQVQNGGISFYVNNKLVLKPNDFKLQYGGACKLCDIPSDLRFRNFILSNTSNNRDIGIYVSNFKITAL